jgi:hypothetical protein
LLAKFADACNRLDERTELLDRLARWRDDLQERLWRAQTCFELVDCDIDIDPLAIEVDNFKRVCKAFAWRPANGRAAA